LSHFKYENVSQVVRIHKQKIQHATEGGKTIDTWRKHSQVDRSTDPKWNF